MTALSRPDLPVTTRRRFLSLTGLGALGALVLDASRKAEPALAAGAPLLRPDAAGTSARPLCPLRVSVARDAEPGLRGGRRAPARSAERGATPRRRPPEGGDMNVTRRELLVGAGAAAGTAAVAGALGAKATDVFAGRDEMTRSLPVDRVVRTTCSPNCTGSCGQLAFVRDGKVVKVQQAADYPEEEYNPRGCMKGISYHTLIHGPDRIQTPLVRDGERGLREVPRGHVGGSARPHRRRAQAHRRRPGAGTPSTCSARCPGRATSRRAPPTAPARRLGMIHGTSFDFNGDLPMGMPITFGVQNAEHESKDWAKSRFILLIGANPLETRIPDVHFIHDAVAAGARLVVVDPTFSSTAAKADAWLQIKPGHRRRPRPRLVSRQVIEDGAADWDFMRTFTDAPLLVRADTGRRLRAHELAAGQAHDPGPAAGVGLGEYGAEAPPVGTAPELPPGPPAHGLPPLSRDRYVAWDAARGGAVVIGTDRLGVPEGTDLALDGEYTVKLADGSRVRVTPGFALVRQELDTWTPEKAAEVTGVPAETIVRLARSFAAQRARRRHHGRRQQPLVPRRPHRPRLRPALRRSPATSAAPAAASPCTSASTRCVWTRRPGGPSAT